MRCLYIWGINHLSFASFVEISPSLKVVLFFVFCFFFRFPLLCKSFYISFDPMFLFLLFSLL